MNWSVKQYKEFLQRRGLNDTAGILDKIENSSEKSKPLKYRNVKVPLDDHCFDSKREADVYCNLKACCSAGVISDLQLQPRFLLQDAFVDRFGKKQRAVYYIADFSYRDSDNRLVVVDVKSKATQANAVYRLKRKFFLFRYRDVIFREIF